MKDIQEITLPKLGESIVSATIVNWLKKVGDRIAVDDPLVEVSTDKVSSEIPSPIAGVLVEILAHTHQEIDVGAPLAKISIESTVSTQIKKNEDLERPKSFSTTHQKSGFFSPAVLHLAQKEGISLETLGSLQGTGFEGRVSKKDIERFLQTRISHSAPCKTKDPKNYFVNSSFEEVIAMNGMRKAIAENMVRSFYQAPHASLVQEVDVTEIMNEIAKIKERFLEVHGAKLTITSFLIKALSNALEEFPLLNASVKEENIIIKKYINVGIAVHVPQGLVVPVIKHCKDLDTICVAKALSDVSNKARAGKLLPDDVTEGTITLTNFGMSGALMGIPIIRYPEVAILGAGTIEKRVVVQEDDSIAIRKRMYITLTFDHRVIDGIYGCEFLKCLKNHLSNLV